MSSSVSSTVSPNIFAQDGKILAEEDDIFTEDLIDEEDGMWLVDIPYIRDFSNGIVRRKYQIPVGTREETSGRGLRDILLMCNEPTIGIASHSEKCNVLNGKRYSKDYNFQTPSRLMVNPVKELSVRSLINDYQQEWYDIFYLVCGRLKGIDLQEWFSRGKQCTRIGSNIAKAMVKVAGTRIFNEPEQSMVELLANSVDSYATLQGKPKVGRFGMGFFSILYFLIGNPERSLNILTTTFDKSIKTYTTVCLRIKEINGSLCFNIRVCDTKSTQTGTLMFLDSNNGFSSEETTSFTKFAEYLSYIKTVPIYKEGIFINKGEFSEEFLSDIFTSTEKKMIDFSVGKTAIYVCDRAEGMTLDTILNSLLVPSISTKGIQVGTQGTQGDQNTQNTQGDYVNYSTIILGSVDKIGYFHILINRVVVVKIPIGFSEPTVLLSLPSTAVLPVTRDDVIIESVEKEFSDSVRILINLAIEHQDLLLIENALLAYKTFTSNSDNRNRINAYINEIYDSVKEQIIVNIHDIEIYKVMKEQNAIPRNLKVFRGSRVNPFVNEAILNKLNIPVHNDIFTWKKVVLVSPLYKGLVSNGSTYSYIFVPYSVHSVSSWKNSLPLSYKYDYLEQPSKDSVLKNVSEIVNDPLYQKYDHIFNHIYSVMMNSITIKIYAGVNVKFLLGNLIEYLLDVKSYTDENYFYYCVNRSINLVGNITEKIGYAQERRLCMMDSVRFHSISSFPSEYHGNISIIFKQCVDAMYEFTLNINSDPVGWIAYFIPFTHFMDFPFKSQYSEYDKEYLLDIVKHTGNWIEVILAMRSISRTMSDPEKTRSITDSTIFYEQIHSVYEKYLRGRVNYKAITTTEWKDNPIYMNAVKDLSLWIKLHFLSNEITFTPNFNVTINPQFSTKQLINYVFKHDTIDFSALSKESRDLSLQILEISINAGTTKPFLEATLTELIQNSMDAIRLTNPRNKAIEATVTEIQGNRLAISVKDHVGMDINNIIAISIPFYSNKVASEMVTGEMGTGFFNIYRESEFVIIDTFLSGKRTQMKQTPVRDKQGNVVDILTELVQDKNVINILKERIKGDKKNGTTITFVVKFNNLTEKLHVFNRVNTFFTDVIGLMDFEGILLNGNEIKKSKRLIYQLDELECYYCENAPTSYILTKGVPFYPFYDFFKDKKDIQISPHIFDTFQSNLIINIKHGFYTPVQSRTSLNISSENLKKLHKFLSEALFRAMVEKIYQAIQLLDPLVLDLYLPNWTYTFGADQVLPKIIQPTQILSNWNGKDLFFGFILPVDTKKYKYEGNVNISIIFSESALPTKSIKEIAANIDKIFEFLKQNITEKSQANVEMVDKIHFITKFWFSNKEYKPIGYRHLPSSGKLPDEDTADDAEMSPEFKYAVKITQLYVDEYTKLANVYIKKYPEIRYPEITVNIKFESSGVLGFYDPSSQTICLADILKGSEKNIRDFQRNIRKYIENNGSLRQNRFFQDMFGYQEPCSLVVHEIEHARRIQGHNNSGAHDDVSLEVFGNPLKRYTYSESANLVYLKLVEDGLIRKWLESIAGINI